VNHATQLDRIAELVQHDLGPGASVTCSLDLHDGSTLLTFRSGKSALCVHISRQCTASFSRLDEGAAKERLREMFEDFT